MPAIEVRTALPPTAVQPEPAASIVQQVAPALVPPIQLVLAAPPQPGAPQSLTIRLDPAELGQVQVRIERTADGPAKVELTVERADTLITLIRDQPQLQQALTLAGVPPEGRTLQFNLAPDGSLSGSLSGGAGSFTAGSGSGGSQRHPGHSGGGGAPEAAALASHKAWSRAGLDITA